MKELGYTYIRFDKSRGRHLLLEKATNRLEWWVASKCYAGFTLPYKNTDLEFCGSADEGTAPF